MKYAVLFRLYNETLTTPSIRDWINKTKMFKTVTNLFIYFVISFRYVLSLCFSRLFKIRAAAVFLWKIFINFICYVCGGSSEQSDEKTQWIIIKYVIAYFGVTFSYFITNTDRWFFFNENNLKNICFFYFNLSNSNKSSKERTGTLASPSTSLVKEAAKYKRNIAGTTMALYRSRSKRN